MKTHEVIATMASRFTSLNEVPVDRAMITRTEWDTLMASVDWLTKEFEKKVETSIQVATDEELDHFMKVCRKFLDDRQATHSRS